MGSKNTEPSKANTTRHMVTYTMKTTKFNPAERFTEEVKGDLAEWHTSKTLSGIGTKVVIEFAILLWD